MLTVVKNQIKVTLLSIKYGLMRQMLNKTTFITNILFMLLNNASFILQWVILYSLKDNIGGYTFKQVLLLWGFAAGTYGVSHFFFKRVFSLSDIINTGKLDASIIQPKNVLLSVITSDVEASALGDLIYAYIMLFICDISISSFLLFTLFIICGGIIMTSIAIIYGSLAFWFNNTEMLADTGNSLMLNFATYPEGIFKGVVKTLFYTLIPIGFANYIPVQILTEFNVLGLLAVLGVTTLILCMAISIFYKGLKNYSSSNLMSARI